MKLNYQRMRHHHRIVRVTHFAHNLVWIYLHQDDGIVMQPQTFTFIFSFFFLSSLSSFISFSSQARAHSPKKKRSKKNTRNEKIQNNGKIIIEPLILVSLCLCVIKKIHRFPLSGSCPSIWIICTLTIFRLTWHFITGH